MTSPTFTVPQALQQGLEWLDAQMLVLLACGQGRHQRAWLLTHDSDVLTEAQQATLQATLARRLAGEPMAYITGSKEFFGLPLPVDARALDRHARAEVDATPASEGGLHRRVSFVCSSTVVRQCLTNKATYIFKYFNI